MKALIALSIALVMITGCATKVRNSSFDRIAECSAGYNFKLTANVEAKIAENLKNGANANAGVEEELKGLFINNAKVSEANAVNLYSKYLECLNTPRP
jgi:hypothetical protein